MGCVRTPSGLGRAREEPRGGRVHPVHSRYCLRDLPLTQSRAVTPLAALVLTVGLHLWRRNALLGIVGGTVVSVALASTVFAG
ncbi:hypothetical protein ACFV2H_25080 [Streptomyces sp. NPDC059629]|uniref:hypothetical protein n=1 Tax=Streptomyces sp. NPDC059629 TaxID=3346889 RepID=UPI00367CD8D2